jgi:hypothetical protein
LKQDYLKVDIVQEHVLQIPNTFSIAMEKKLSDINFFICSTYIDLRSYREEVIKKIQSQAGVINAQEFFGARDNKPIETCLKEVEQSNVFIMLVAFRFGSKDPGSKKYFIEHEYEKAKKMGLPKFVYFMDEETPFPPKFVAKDKESEDLKKFKKKLLKDHTIETFTSPEDLASKVIQNLLKELPNHGFKVGSARKENNDKVAAEVIKKFVTLPKMHYGTEVELTVTLGDYERAPENECNAFSMRFGATARRRFKAVDAKIAEEVRMFYHIYADGEKADDLISLPKDEPVTLMLKTVQGTRYWDEPIYELQDPTEIMDDSFSVTAYSLSSLSAYGQPKKVRVQTGSRSRSELAVGLEFIAVKNKAMDAQSVKVLTPKIPSKRKNKVIKKRMK